MLPSPSRSSLPTPHSLHEIEWDTIEKHLQEANRHGKACLLHYLDRIVLSGTQVPRHLGSLLPSFSLVRSLEMTLKDAAYLNLSEIFEHCVNLKQLKIEGPHYAVVDLFLHHYHDEDSSTGEEPHLRPTYPKLTSLSLQKVKISQKNILTLINAFPGLTTLHIHCIIGHDSCYRPVPSLVRLDLRVLYKWAAHACPNLLDETFCRTVAQTPIDSISVSCGRPPTHNIPHPELHGVLWLGTVLPAVCALVQPNHPSADRERELHVLLDLHPGLHNALSAPLLQLVVAPQMALRASDLRICTTSAVALTAKDSKSSSSSGSHDRKHVVKLHNADEKNLSRFLKHSPSDPCTLLPHLTAWVCHKLTRLSLRIEDKLPLVLASVAQACPQLEELVVKTNILMLDQSHKVEDQTWLIEQSHHPQAPVKHRSWHTRQHRLSGMLAEVRYKYVELEDQIRCLSSLRGLERLVFRVSYLLGGFHRRTAVAQTRRQRCKTRRGLAQASR
ncbi:hypothetical protein BG006_009471 [Podila minutissima]|uniref:Uncharacterized protein n=1 Tax=Podila minutissima TaxID=64525 RepID=A0A9P5SEC7_9FUNG|nr:hypothetical protein BG006_009471 [Podila minutissima]